MQTANTAKNKLILDFVYNFKNIAEKEKWVTRYDKESDSFSCSVNKLPKDARIHYVGDEIAFYITKDNKVKGIFIEYFKSNFIKHAKEARDVKVLIEKELKKGPKDINLVEIKKNKISKKMITKLEEAVQATLAKNIQFTPSLC